MLKLQHYVNSAPVVVNKWFALQSSSNIPGNVHNIQKLLDHSTFDLRNPNKVYYLIGGFCASLVNFHARDGSGYKVLADLVVQLGKMIPQGIPTNETRCV